MKTVLLFRGDLFAFRYLNHVYLKLFPLVPLGEPMSGNDSFEFVWYAMAYRQEERQWVRH